MKKIIIYVGILVLMPVFLVAGDVVCEKNINSFIKTHSKKTITTTVSEVAKKLKISHTDTISNKIHKIENRFLEEEALVKQISIIKNQTDKRKMIKARKEMFQLVQEFLLNNENKEAKEFVFYPEEYSEFFVTGFYNELFQDVKKLLEICFKNTNSTQEYTITLNTNDIFLLKVDPKTKITVFFIKY